MPDGGSGAETGGCGRGNVGRASGGRFKDDNRLEVLGAKLGMGLKRDSVSVMGSHLYILPLRSKADVH